MLGSIVLATALSFFKPAPPADLPLNDLRTLNQFIHSKNNPHIVPYGATVPDQYYATKRTTTAGFRTLGQIYTWEKDNNDDGSVTVVNEHGEKFTLRYNRLTGSNNFAHVVRKMK